MLRYLLILIALQTACAAPIEPCVKFQFYFMQEFSTLIKTLTTQISKLLQLLLEEADRFDLDESEKQMMEMLAKVVEHSKQMDDSEDIFIVFEVLEEIVELLSSFKSDESDSSMSDLSDYSPEHLFADPGVEAFEENIENLINESFQRIATRVESYLKLNHNNDLADLIHTKFQGERDFEEKFEMLEEFLEHIGCKVFNQKDLINLFS